MHAIIRMLSMFKNKRVYQSIPSTDIIIYLTILKCKITVEVNI